MALKLVCDGHGGDLEESDAHQVGRIEKLALCSPCFAKHEALQAVLASKQVEVAAIFETFQREQREASGLKAVPDA